MLLDCDDPEVQRLVSTYVDRLRLPIDRLFVTTDRTTFGRWLGRRIAASYGGAYTYLPRTRHHLVLINLERIDRARPMSLEIVVAEELLHMRDYLDGDRRRHAKHGYDRIAARVAALTGASLTEVRSCLLPVQRRPLRYHYLCPACGLVVHRRVRGTWSCRRCAPVFQRRFQLVLQDDASANEESNAGE
ncbi:MAG: hypothetical protein H0W59_04205 [Chloroflexia bacterium]|jgi:ribosomal protein L37AE/L43A|nr:hypothetical protein [Chloroflexia bacterium]